MFFSCSDFLCMKGRNFIWNSGVKIRTLFSYFVIFLLHNNAYCLFRWFPPGKHSTKWFQNDSGSATADGNSFTERFKTSEQTQIYFQCPKNDIKHPKNMHVQSTIAGTWFELQKHPCEYVHYIKHYTLPTSKKNISTGDLQIDANVYASEFLKRCDVDSPLKFTERM